MIYKKITLLISLLLLTITAYPKKEVNGKIVYEDKTVEVTLLLPYVLGEVDYTDLRIGVNFKDESGKNRRLKPGDALYFEFTDKAGTHKLVSKRLKSIMNWQGGDNQLFFPLVLEGDCSMYYYTDHSRSKGSKEKYFMKLLEKKDRPMIIMKPGKFIEKAGNYFSDCPELKKKIENKDLKAQHAREIANFYNENCNK